VWRCSASFTYWGFSASLALTLATATTTSARMLAGKSW
jgi:hypothetical protein